MLHAFYDPADLDSCLAAWAALHGMGPAVALHSGPMTYHEDMLVLGREDWPEDSGEGPVAILHIANRGRGNSTIPTVANVAFRGISKHQPCCLTTWANFHVSNPPGFIAHLNANYGKSLDADPAYNAVLGIPWTIIRLEVFLTSYEDPAQRRVILADGEAIRLYRKLRGDLQPERPQS